MPRSVVITKPQAASAAFGQLAEQRRKLLDREGALIREGEKARNAGANEAVARIGLELAGVRHSLVGIQGDYAIAELDACQAAKTKVTGDKGYRELVAEAASALGTRLEPWLALDLVIREAGEHGVKLIPLPAVITFEITSARRWLQAHVRVGVLDAAALPAPLRALVEGQ